MPNQQKEDLIDMHGDVTQCLSNGFFRVKLENGFVILAHLSGKIRRNSIRIVLNDRVLVQLSPYDLTRGRIVYRLRKNPPSQPQPPTT
jgi:translation initiation factor IF-1